MAKESGASVTPYVRSIMRIILGFTFCQHGLQKIFGFQGGIGLHHLPRLLLVAGCLETFGGALLLIGLFAKPIALLLSGEMAAAYFTVHAHQGFWTIHNGGELAVVYCFVFLYLCFAGPGPLSLDRLVRKAA
ncbi:MAG: DoxX family protein [Terriglobia bacterium]